MIVRQQIIAALMAALVTLVLAIPIVGVHIISEPGVIALSWDGWKVMVAVVVVFIVQLLKSYFIKSAVIFNYKAKFAPGLLIEKNRKLIISLVILFAIVWPFYASRGDVDIVTLAFIYVMMGLGLNIVVGFAGLLDLGYVAFYAVGAYSYALLSQYFGISFWICLPISGAIAALFGYLLGFPVLRLRGDYLAIVTLGFGEIIRLLLNNMDSLTGGPDGIGNIAKPTLFGLQFERQSSDGGLTFHQFFGLPYSSGDKTIFLYLLALLLVLLSLLVINRLIRMPVGRAWEALREDEIACRSLGLNPMHIKLSAFTLGVSFAGFAGCFFAARQGFINPESFTFIESAIVLAIVVLGGMGSQLGIILAALAMTILPEIAREFDQYRMLLFGMVMVLMMIWRPQGLLPSQRHIIKIETS
ncbi:MAG: high-affinity branched-chain amino acid ABC transporter permease LivM [Gammaproteobacteria bacterium]|nr:high-affinity branched-chain amino acid ABC transporter permease LivM [Gammaproteobacteria bacterium]